MSDPIPSIEDMFGSELDLASLAPADLLARIESNAAELRHREAESLVLAAAWADANGIIGDDIELDLPWRPLVERLIQVGGPGTPEVAEFCAAELAAVQRLPFGTGQGQLADALDLRHRLPRLWAQVRAGEVRAWKACHVAQATRQLSPEAAGDVDHAISGYVESVSWRRFRTILTAAILAADPDLARERADRAKADRDVWATDSDDGLKMVLAKLDSGDATWFLAMVNRIADILKAQGSLHPVGVRRATAMRILAQPAEAIQLLAAHASDPEPGEPDLPAEPGEGEAQAPGAGLEVDLPPALDRLDPHRLKPRVVLYFHVAESAVRDGFGLVRPQHGTAQTLDQFRSWLAEAGCPVQIRPVVVPAEVEPVDGYEIPWRIREAVRLREVAEVWPYGTCTSGTMDLDHTTAYRPMITADGSPGGPPKQTGQTGVSTLGPLPRRPHRVKTHGRWRARQPEPGVYVWRSPHGWIFLVTNHGTMSLGRNPYAHSVWETASPARAAVPSGAAPRSPELVSVR